MKVGLEVHRQLDTRHKLFCNCPTILSSGVQSIRFERRLRPTQSELGQIDPAALFEFRRGRTVEYEADNDTSCLVEMDEEPPHPINTEAVDVALMITLLFNGRPMDEIHVMRKLVIDGSNTTGFQRTTIIGLNGAIKVDGKDVPIQQVTLEEDASRKMAEAKNKVTFQLDRLGVPLIEITTGPVIHDPEDAGKIASAIGRVLRATRKVKRGLGTIRQDLNISIKQGALVEIKGVQELELVAKVVALEVQRQQNLLAVRDELRKRNVHPKDLEQQKIVELTDMLRESNSKIIQNAIQKGGKILGIRLRGFNGLLGRELIPGVRLGTELAKRAVFWGRVGGVFHSDELPGHGIEKTEKDSVWSKLDCRETDAFVLVADEEQSCREALEAVLERAREAIERVPEETRAANPDGTTQYMRPRPGAARMYPETDVPPVQIGTDRLEKIRSQLPRMPEEIAKGLETKYAIGSKLALQVANSEYYNAFERIVAESQAVSPSYVATVLTESLKSMEREKIPVENLTDKHFRDTFRLAASGATAKESIVKILEWLANHPKSDAKEAVSELKVGMLTKADLEAIVEKIVSENRVLVEKNRDAAVGKLTNLVMAEVRGRADPRLVIQLLQNEISRG